MRHAKLQFTVAVCLSATFGAMAFGSAGAQANGHVFVNLQLLDKTMEVESLKPDYVEILTSLGSTKLQVLCSNIVYHDALLFSNGSASATVLFSSCETRLGLTLWGVCKPLEPLVAKVTTLLIKHNGDTYVLFALESGFASPHFPGPCTIGLVIHLKGSAVAECGVLNGGGIWEHRDCAEERIEPEIREVPGTTLFPNDRLKWGANPASLDGDVSLILKAPHSGVKWGGEAL